MSEASSPATPTLEESQAVSGERARAYLASLDPSIHWRDDDIAAELARENSSPKSKLGKIYRLVDEAAAAAGPFVACSKGCSACCKMNVSISALEAERIGQATGRRPFQLSAAPKYLIEEFSGVPCPFLVNDLCSIYEARPFVCRTHHSFDTTSYWCQPERSFVDGMGVVTLNGATTAHAMLAARTTLRDFADIRDFFPTEVK